MDGARVIDAHVHVACPDKVRFPRHPTGVGTDWWTSDGSDDQLRCNLVANGVERAVIVQSTGLYAYDCRCAAAVVAAEPDRFALVTTLDMDADDPAALVEAHAATGAVGVRAASAAAEEPPWLSDGRGAAVWDAAERAALSIVALVRTPHLDALGALCRRAPSVPVVLDHCGMPRLDGPGADEAVLRAAAVPSLHMKVTTLNLAGALAEKAGVLLDDAERADLLAATSLRLWWP
ncbi:MAG TPA: amidohydrolase family protein [Acidimicrobiales bacterium]